MNVRTILASSAVLGLLAAGDTAAQKLSLRVERGLVTLDAENVTVDEVLARWASVTGLNVVSKNGRGSDIPLTLRIDGMAERDALALVLRDLSGYIMGERRDPITGLMTIDRVMILPDSAAQASTPPARAPRVVAPPLPTFEADGQLLAVPSADANSPEPDSSDDDTPRELAPTPASSADTVSAAEAPRVLTLPGTSTPIRLPGRQTELPKPVPPIDPAAAAKSNLPDTPINSPFGTFSTSPRPGQTVPSAPASATPPPSATRP